MPNEGFMPTDLFFEMFGIVIMLLAIVYALMPQKMGLKILGLLIEHGPLTIDQIGERLQVPPKDLISILYLMEMGTRAIQKHFRSPWDKEGNKQTTEIFIVTSIGRKFYEQEANRD